MALLPASLLGGHLGGHGGGHGRCRTRGEGGGGGTDSGSVFGVKRGRGGAGGYPLGAKKWRGIVIHTGATRAPDGERSGRARRSERTDEPRDGFARKERREAAEALARGVAVLAAARERARLARRKQTLEPERRREEIFPVAPETRRRRAPGGRVGARTAPLLHGSVHARGHGRARREGEGDGRHLRCSAGVLQRNEDAMAWPSAFTRRSAASFRERRAAVNRPSRRSVGAFVLSETVDRWTGEISKARKSFFSRASGLIALSGLTALSASALSE